MDGANPLIDDRFVDFLLYDVLEVESLCRLPAFSHHSRETFALYLDGIRRFARKELAASYRPMDLEAPVFVDGKVETHALLPPLWKQMAELGVLSATRPEEVGGSALPMTVHTLSSAYLMAANPAAYGYAGLTMGAAHLIEAFGSHELKQRFMYRLYEGQWSGTMALTEPQAGSSLADIRTTARLSDGGHHLIAGSKIFISGGDHRATENIVHLTLARIEGAPAGSSGISLFAIPSHRLEDGKLIDNDVTVAGMIHKIGWKGLPSLALEFGDRGDCRGYLVGEPNRGLSYMFQMMNEARIMVGVNGAATASAAYHEARLYSFVRRQGRAPGGSRGEPVAIVEHADVRRMLLRQKAIVEGSFALLATVSTYADLAAHCPDSMERENAQRLLDLLTPIAKTFPAELGFESNALAVQVHGGYGYSSEYVVESYLRDQKLNSLHEGTSGIQSLDLLGRKAIKDGGAGLRALAAEIESAIARANDAGIDAEWSESLRAASSTIGEVTTALAARGSTGDVVGMLAHSFDYLEMVSIVVVAWQWLRMATVVKELENDQFENDQFENDQLENDQTGDDQHPDLRNRGRGTLAAAQYWIRTEVPRVTQLGKLCTEGEDSYLNAEPEWF